MEPGVENRMGQDERREDQATMTEICQGVELEVIEGVEADAEETGAVDVGMTTTVMDSVGEGEADEIVVEVDAGAGTTTMMKDLEANSNRCRSNT